MKWLENRTDPVEKWLGGALEAAQARTGDEVARRRVWARIEDLPLNDEAPARRARSIARPVLAGTLLAAVGVVALLWLVPWPGQLAQETPAPGAVAKAVPSPVAPSESIASETKPIRAGRQKAHVTLPGGAAVDLDANSVLGWDAQRRPQVESGQARFEVAHQAPGNHFAVAAGPYVISVVGTKFRVGVTEGRVSVEVEEGVVEVSRGDRTVRLTEGDSWAGPVRGPAPSAAEHRSAVNSSGARRATRLASASVSPASAAPPPDFAPIPVTNDLPTVAPPANTAKPSALAEVVTPKTAPASAELKQANAALGEGRAEDALDILSRCAKGTGPAAENAAYEMGRVLRDRLHRPKAALAAWNQYRARFPQGLLRAETDLSVLETLASLGDNKSALAEAEAFLARYPRSERREEVSKLAARVRATTGP
jgi:ferric-dicitrate binding protein FerR (iron transport regulator)